MDGDSRTMGATAAAVNAYVREDCAGAATALAVAAMADCNADGGGWEMCWADATAATADAVGADCCDDGGVAVGGGWLDATVGATTGG